MELFFLFLSVHVKMDQLMKFHDIFILYFEFNSLKYIV